MIAKTLKDIFIYSKNDSFKVIGGIFCDENTPFKELFILAFVRAKAPCFRKRGRFHILDAQN
ncbi:hypothetical protein RGC23_03950 [Helicobacter pylori]|nr:hypothetical protein [Helicobacter pylori]